MKKIFILFLILSFSLFPQNPPKYLTQAYLDSFIKNFKAIEKDLNKLDIESQVESLEAALEDALLYNKAVNAIKKYGFGEKPFEVIMAITYATAGAIMEDNIDIMGKEYPQMKDQYQAMADNYKKLVNPDDYKLVVKNIAKIKKATGLED